jgi:hypothetical protein
VKTLQSVAVRRDLVAPLATALEARPGTDAQDLARTARQVATTRDLSLLVNDVGWFAGVTVGSDVVTVACGAGHHSPPIPDQLDLAFACREAPPIAK